MELRNWSVLRYFGKFDILKGFSDPIWVVVFKNEFEVVKLRNIKQLRNILKVIIGHFYTINRTKSSSQK